MKNYISKDYSGVVKSRNGLEKYISLAKYLKYNSKRLKSADKSSNFYEQINSINKKEDNKQNNSCFFKEKRVLQKPELKINRKKNILRIPQNKNIYYKPCIRSSSVFNRTNKTIINNHRKNRNIISSKSENHNRSNLNNNFTNTSNRITCETNKRQKINHLNSSSLNSIDIKKRRIHSSLLSSSRIKNKFNFSKKANETSKNIDFIAFKTINEGNSIIHKLKKNYSSYKEPTILSEKNNSLSESLNGNKIDQVGKIDLNKLRADLKLKDSKGLLGKINEIKILEKDLKKIGERLTEDKMKILKPIAQGILRQDILANKKLKYNVGIENRKFLRKYFKYFGKLTNFKK